jgi:flagellar biosynthesis/type III secretory pathway chaperone
MTDPTELEHLRDFRENWHLLREKLEAQIQWLQKENKELNKVLEYARQELRKSDRRAAEIVDRTRLTPKERLALRFAADAYALDDDDEECASIANSLRGLLERLA